MTIEQEDVIRILRILDGSDFDELHLEMGDLKMRVSKNGAGKIAEVKKSSSPSQAKLEQDQDLPSASVNRQLKSPGPDSSVSFPKPETPIQLAFSDKLIPIKSPLLGTFYLSPKPGAPNFISVGSKISEEDTVCLVEVMKTFTTVKSGVKGRIVEICAENAQMVEYQQTLFLVEPDTGTV